MKTKNLIVMGWIGLLLTGAGFYRFWALIELAASFHGTLVGSKLNADAWISFGAGGIGVVLILGAGVAYLVRRRRDSNPHR